MPCVIAPARRLALILFLAFVASFASAQAAHAAYPVKLKLTIERVKALDCIDEDEVLGGCGSAPDFYTHTYFDGEEVLDTEDSVDDDEGEITPDWKAERSVDLERGKVAVSIHLRDQDGGFRGPSELVDLTPGDGRALDFVVNLAPCGVSGGLTADCAQVLTSTGSLKSSGADDDRAEITVKVEVLDVDTDGDALLDGWETRGLDTNGDRIVDVDLKQQGADPRRHDLFVEVDCLADRGGDGDLADELDHSHCPQKNAIDDVVKAFANAPGGPRTSNPDGTAGVQLHIDTGTLFGPGRSSVNGAGGVVGTYGDLGEGGDEIAESPANRIIDWDGATGNPGTSFYDLKAANFDNRRRFAYRYALFAHTTNSRAAVNDCTSGWAESIPANDFFVTLGGVRDDDADGVIEGPCYQGTPGNLADDDGDGRRDEDPFDLRDNDGDGTVDEDGGNLSVGNRQSEAGTFLHEFGHAIGLSHGGGDDLNNKPNYLSVMNYSFQACSVWSLPPTAPAGAPALPGGCDFSRDALPALEERFSTTAPVFSGIDECQGFDGGVFGFGARNFNGNARPGGGLLLEGATCAAPNTTNISFDVNGDSDAPDNLPLGNLPGYDDWDNLVYAFQGAASFTNGIASPVADEPDARILEDARRATAAAIAPDLSVDKTGPAGASPGDRVAYDISVANIGNGPALDVTLGDTRPDGSTASFDVGYLTLGADAKRVVGFDIPCTAKDGSVLTDTAHATGRNLYGDAESSTANNSRSLSTTVHAPVLALAKTATSSVRAGEAITYRLTYENTGSGTASGVKITDTLPADVYYSAALDGGGGPAPDSVTRNADATTTLTWSIGAVTAASGPHVVEYAARPSLLLTGGTVRNSARLTFTNANDCVYDAVTATQAAAITVLPPTRNPLTPGYWKTHPEDWTSEILARIQATDQRFDGANGSTPDGRLSAAEVAGVLGAGGSSPKVLATHLLATYFNLATRRINAGTAISSKVAAKIGAANVRDAARYAMATLALRLDANTQRYSDAIRVMDDINSNRIEVY